MKWSIILLLLIESSYAANTNIDAAFKREFIFLSSQLEELKKQKNTLKNDYLKARRAAEKSIERGQARLVQLNMQNEKLKEKLYQIEKNIETMEVDKSVSENLSFMMAKRLGTKDLGLKEAFDLAAQKLQKNSSAQRSTSKLFLENGEKVDAQMLQLGKFASFGIYQNKIYQLAPAGNAQFKIWNELATSDKGLASEQLISTFIYDNPQNEVLKRKGQNVFQFIQSGGTIAWVIVLMGGISMLFCLVRLLGLKRYQLSLDKKSLPIIEDIQTAKELENIDDIIDEGMIHEHKIIDRFGAVILVLAAVAPLMGLLGTVTGMISTFDIITEFGTGDPKLLSQGISEALITTELGLIVAIPSLLFGNMLNSWGRNMKLTLDKDLLSIINEK